MRTSANKSMARMTTLEAIFVMRDVKLCLTRIRHGDFVDFIGIEPNLALAAIEHAGGEPLL